MVRIKTQTHSTLRWYIIEISVVVKNELNLIFIANKGMLPLMLNPIWLMIVQKEMETEVNNKSLSLLRSLYLYKPSHGIYGGCVYIIVRGMVNECFKNYNIARKTNNGCKILVGPEPELSSWFSGNSFNFALITNKVNILRPHHGCYQHFACVCVYTRAHVQKMRRKISFHSPYIHFPSFSPLAMMRL